MKRQCQRSNPMQRNIPDVTAMKKNAAGLSLMYLNPTYIVSEALIKFTNAQNNVKSLTFGRFPITRFSLLLNVNAYSLRKYAFLTVRKKYFLVFSEIIPKQAVKMLQVFTKLYKENAPIFTLPEIISCKYGRGIFINFPRSCLFTD